MTQMVNSFPCTLRLKVSRKPTVVMLITVMYKASMSGAPSMIL